MDAHSWYCDSGATRHITPNKHYFVSYTKFANPGGSNGSNSERNVQDRKSVHEKKQPYWMTSGDFVYLVNDSQGDYFDVFLTVHHSIELFHLPTLMYISLFINTMYVTLLSSTCSEH